MSVIAKHPMIKWAEVKDSIYLTIEVPDCQEPEVKISEDNLAFKCTTKEGAYACDLKLKGKVDPTSEDSKWTVTGRDVQVHMAKKDVTDDDERWGGLLADKKLGRNLIKPDFDKWVDSDDEAEGAGFDMGQFGAGGGMPGMGGGGMPGMGGMGGMPGMGGMGGMGGMPGMGGMGGMPGMGGMGGMPGMEGMGDMSKMMDMMKGMDGGADAGAAGDDEDDEDDDLPDLEEDEQKA